MSKSQGSASASPYSSLPASLKFGKITKSEKYIDNERKLEGAGRMEGWRE